MKTKNLLILMIALLSAAIVHGQTHTKTFEWANHIDNVGGDNDIHYPEAIVTDASGNSYITGYFAGAVDMDPSVGVATLTSVGQNDIFIAKYDVNGNYVWANRMGSTADDVAHSLALDAEENLIIGGRFSSGTIDMDPGPGDAILNLSSGYDAFVAKYDSDGDFIWANKHGSTGFDYVYAVAVDAVGNILIGGFFSGTVDFDPGEGGPEIANLTSVSTRDAFFAKYDADGNYIWANGLAGTGSSNEWVAEIAVNSTGEVCIAGSFSGTTDFDPSAETVELVAPAGGVYFAKYDANGNYLFVKGFISDDIEIDHMTIDSEGSFLLVGDFDGDPDFDPGAGKKELFNSGEGDGFVAKYDAEGNYVWAYDIGEGASSSVVTDVSNNVYVSGMFGGSHDFDPGSGVAIQNAELGRDMYIVKYDAFGNYLWVEKLTLSAYWANASAIALDSDNNVLIAGRLEGTIDAPYSLDSGTPDYDMFTAKLSQCIVDDESGLPVTTWYADADGDSYGDPTIEITNDGCNPPAGYVQSSNDCDDNDANSHTAWYADNDGDGFGNPDTLVMECTQPEGYVTDNTDVDDEDAVDYPGAPSFPVTKLIGTAYTNNGGSIFAIDDDGDYPKKLFDFGSEGYSPEYTHLIESNGKLWGMTEDGGTERGGVIFRMNTDGTGYEKVHDFDDTNGSSPRGSLIESNGKLWGMTAYGGTDEYGVIFSMNTDGTGYEKVHDFDGTNGRRPYGSLMESSGKLWGMTAYGGTDGHGVIFSMNTDGTGYEKVHDFDGTNGRRPYGSLIESNGKLWGMTAYGGTDEYGGVIFSMNTDGTGYEKVHDFDDTNGSSPRGSLIESNGKLWGMTLDGGTDEYGVIFSMNTDGTGYEKVHDFDGTNGRSPSGDLVESNGKLLGMTEGGATENGNGVIFSMNTDGTGYEKVHDFDGTNGRRPYGSLMESNGKLWGMTGEGGIAYYDDDDGNGTIFSINTNATGFIKTHDFGEVNGTSPSGSLMESNGKLWGITGSGGENDNGVIFSMNLNGTGFNKIHDFDLTNGSYGTGSFVESNGKLWGMTAGGGVDDNGVIFSINADGTGFAKIHDFDNTNGSNPFGSLVESNGKLWGMTASGGLGGYGVIFSINTDGSTNFTQTHDFDDTNGSSPQGSLVESNGKLWGMTYGGGISSYGVIFSMNTDGTDFTKMHDFDGTNGRRPYGSLVESNGKFWGMTTQGGGSEDSYGVIFNIDTDGMGFTKVHDFDYTNGATPQGNLIESNGKLWGITNGGGSNGGGVIFNIDTDGMGFTKLFDLNDETGGNPQYGSLIAIFQKGEQVLAFDEQEDKTYGETTFELAATSNVDNPFLYESSDLGVISIVGSTATIVGAGEATITATQAEDENYTPSDMVGQSVTVTKAGLTATAADQNKTYGAANPALTFGYAGFVNGDDASALETAPTAGTVATIGSDAGSYAITLSEEVDTNYEIAEVAGTLTIGKAALTATADDQNKTYGSANPALTLGYAGFVNGDDASGLDTAPTAGTVATIGSDAGSYFITVSEEVDTNYEIAEVAGTLTVGKAALTATAADQNKTYGAANPALTLGYAGFVNGDDASGLETAPTAGTAATIGSDAGSYAITLSEEVDINYEIGEVAGTLTVGKAALTAAAEEQSINEGETLPTFTIGYTGFVNGDDESVIDTTPAADVSITNSSEPGTFDITLSGGADGNYAITLVNGILTIEEVLGLLSGNQLRIYPNPAQNYFMVDAAAIESIEILDANGIPHRATNVGGRVDISTLSGGTYFILMKDVEGKILSRNRLIKR